MDIVIIAVIILISVLVITYFSIKLTNKFAKADLIDLFSYENKLVSVGKVYHSAEDGGFYHTRVSLIDKKNGKIIHKTSISSELDVIGIQNQHIWLNDKHIYAVDFIKNKLMFTTKRIYKKYPEFDNIEFLNPHLNHNSSKIIFKTDTGYKYCIDCKTFIINKYQEQSEISEDVEETEEEIDDINLKSKHFCFVKPKKADRFILKYKNEQIGNGISFINPQILCENVIKNQNQEVDFIVFIHFQKLHSSSDFILTKINSVGKIIWNIQQKELKIKIKELHITKINKVIKFDNDLILMISTGYEKLVSINILSGCINWSNSVF